MDGESAEYEIRILEAEVEELQKSLLRLGRSDGLGSSSIYVIPEEDFSGNIVLSDNELFHSTRDAEGLIGQQSSSPRSMCTSDISPVVLLSELQTVLPPVDSKRLQWDLMQKRKRIEALSIPIIAQLERDVFVLTSERVDAQLLDDTLVIYENRLLEQGNSIAALEVSCFTAEQEIGNLTNEQSEAIPLCRQDFFDQSISEEIPVFWGIQEKNAVFEELVLAMNRFAESEKLLNEMKLQENTLQLDIARGTELLVFTKILFNELELIEKDILIQSSKQRVLQETFIHVPDELCFEIDASISNRSAELRHLTGDLKSAKAVLALLCSKLVSDELSLEIFEAELSFCSKKKQKLVDRQKSFLQKIDLPSPHNLEPEIANLKSQIDSFEREFELKKNSEIEAKKLHARKKKEHQWLLLDRTRLYAEATRLTGIIESNIGEIDQLNRQIAGVRKELILKKSHSMEISQIGLQVLQKNSQLKQGLICREEIQNQLRAVNTNLTTCEASVGRKKKSLANAVRTLAVLKKREISSDLSDKLILEKNEAILKFEKTQSSHLLILPATVCDQTADKMHARQTLIRSRRELLLDLKLQVQTTTERIKHGQTQFIVEESTICKIACLRRFFSQGTQKLIALIAETCMWKNRQNTNMS